MSFPRHWKLANCTDAGSDIREFWITKSFPSKLETQTSLYYISIVVICFSSLVQGNFIYYKLIFDKHIYNLIHIGEYRIIHPLCLSTTCSCLLFNNTLSKNLNLKFVQHIIIWNNLHANSLIISFHVMNHASFMCKSVLKWYMVENRGIILICSFYTNAGNMIFFVLWILLNCWAEVS